MGVFLKNTLGHFLSKENVLTFSIKSVSFIKCETDFSFKTSVFSGCF